MKKIIIVVVSILLLSGCYDYSEIDDISIITGILLDYHNNQYEMISEVLENEKESKINIYKTSCKSINLCLLKISEESNKELFISHLKALILTDRTINKDTSFYDYFLRNSKSKMNFYVYYIEDQYIDKLFNNNKNTSLFLKDIIDYNTRNYSSLIKLSFTDMIQKNIEYGIINIYPSITIDDEKVYIDKLVSFNKENKTILSNTESVIYNILLNNAISSYITIPCDNENFTLKLSKSKSKYKYDNKLTININNNAILSSYNCKYDLNEKESINILEQLSNDYIKNKSYELLKLSKNNNTDFLGITRYIYKHNKEKINLNNINEVIYANTKITSIGESR